LSSDGNVKSVARGFCAVSDVLRVRVERAAAAGSKLRAAKGINVPDTRLPVPALTDKDISEAVAVLDDILCRMADHHYKKNALLRKLRSWRPT
jgi:pyruvate kinase